MNILDENIITSQRQRLRSWRIQVWQIGVDIARKGLQDEEIIPFLHQQRRPTFFTRDRGFYRHEVCHRQYGIVCLDVVPEENQKLPHKLSYFSIELGIRVGRVTPDF